MSHIPDHEDPSPLQWLALYLFRTMPDSWRGLVALVLLGGALAICWLAGGVTMAAVAAALAGLVLLAVNGVHHARRSRQD